MAACQGNSPPPGETAAGADVRRARWLSEDEQRVWRIMVAVHARLVSRLDTELQAAHGISLRDYEVLVHLSEADGSALRMAELADRLFVSPSGLTRRLDGMVRDGLVKRQACLNDRRGTLAVLTSAGWSVLENAAPTHVAAVRRYVFDPVDATQMEQLAASLSAMNAGLEATAPAGATTSEKADRPVRPIPRRPSRPPPRRDL